VNARPDPILSEESSKKRGMFLKDRGVEGNLAVGVDGRPHHLI